YRLPKHPTGRCQSVPIPCLLHLSVPLKFPCSRCFTSRGTRRTGHGASPDPAMVRASLQEGPSLMPSGQLPKSVIRNALFNASVFYECICLLRQAVLHPPGSTVSKFLEAADFRVEPGSTLRAFVRATGRALARSIVRLESLLIP